MAIETQIDDTDPKSQPFGTRLKAAREAKGLAKKEIAVQLCLSEKIVSMMERDRYPADLPVTFIRGYLRTYSKLLDIPEDEVKKALEPIKSRAVQQTIPVMKPLPSLARDNHFMKLFTYAIFFCVGSLVLMWWFSYPQAPNKIFLDPSQSFAKLVSTEKQATQKDMPLSQGGNALTLDPLAPLKNTIALKNNITPITKITETSNPNQIKDLYN